MARMAREDGLTMTLRPEVRRNHHRPIVDALGSATGDDGPLQGWPKDGAARRVLVSLDPTVADVLARAVADHVRALDTS